MKFYKYNKNGIGVICHEHFQEEDYSFNTRSYRKQLVKKEMSYYLNLISFPETFTTTSCATNYRLITHLSCRIIMGTCNEENASQFP